MKVGYVVKRFPRASETFIGQEILGLERLGVEVVIFALRPNDRSVEHEWLAKLSAPVYTFEPQGFSTCWRALQERSRSSSQQRQAVHAALLTAFDHPKRSGKRYLVESWWIGEMSRVLGIQHLHAHFANHPTFVAMLSHRISDLPFSFTAHAKDIYLDGPTPDLWRRQLDEAAFGVTVSESNRRYLGSVLGSGFMDKLSTLYNGVDLDWIRPRRDSATKNGRSVLFASRLIEKKGADVLVAAVPQVLQRDPSVRFTIVGEGAVREDLKTKAASLGVTENIRFAGFLPHQDLISLLADSDLFVLPCRVAADGDRDALPTVLLEAMAAGLPCISTAVNGVPEIIDHGQTGLIVPENDPVSLAAAIDRLMADPDTRKRMGIAGRRKAEGTFDLRQSTGRLRQLFESSIAGHPIHPETRADTAAVV
jgi:colanic acid/amylovoran biosynthesis glycosyltransferase